jgi:hypothetical protein
VELCVPRISLDPAGFRFYLCGSRCKSSDLWITSSVMVVAQVLRSLWP